MPTVATQSDLLEWCTLARSMREYDTIDTAALAATFPMMPRWAEEIVCHEDEHSPSTLFLTFSTSRMHAEVGADASTTCTVFVDPSEDPDGTLRVAGDSETEPVTITTWPDRSGVFSLPQATELVECLAELIEDLRSNGLDQ